MLILVTPKGERVYRHDQIMKAIVECLFDKNRFDPESVNLYKVDGSGVNTHRLVVDRLVLEWEEVPKLTL